ncbi:MAG: hypothetical protein EOO28_25470 [Comamonadaceae bacterium]|nr:MAG: hypothetical protein EOO28_25470 [Comamonadaceae bacterium]
MTEPLAQLRATLDADGMAGALAFLNARVPHRFTAIFRLEEPNLRLIHFHDSTGNPPLEVIRLIPVGRSLCKFALRNGSWVTEDAKADPESSSAPMSEIMVSYVGLPLQGPASQLIGTFCHFDTESKPLPDGEFEFLEQAVKLLPGYLAA